MTTLHKMRIYIIVVLCYKIDDLVGIPFVEFLGNSSV